MSISTKNKTITITLEAPDVMQILDALGSRAQAWENTEAALNGDFESDEFFMPEECEDSSEAAEIAQHFRDIISTIENQIS